MTITVTRKSRIGFSWSNTPETRYSESGQSYLQISDPGYTPDESGYPKRVAAEFAKIARMNNSNYWSKRWFVLSDGEWVPVNLEIFDLDLLLSKVEHRIEVETLPAETV